MGGKNNSGITFQLNVSPSAECLPPPHYMILEYPSAKLKVFVSATCRLRAIRHGGQPLSFPHPAPSILVSSVCSHRNQSRLRRPLTPCLASSSHFPFFRPDTPTLFPKLFAVFILINTKSCEWAGCAASRS